MLHVPSPSFFFFCSVKSESSGMLFLPCIHQTGIFEQPLLALCRQGRRCLLPAVYNLFARPHTRAPNSSNQGRHHWVLNGLLRLQAVWGLDRLLPHPQSAFPSSCVFYMQGFFLENLEHKGVKYKVLGLLH